MAQELLNLTAYELAKKIEAHEVSSREAACSVAPCDRVWADEDTWFEADDTCAAPSARAVMREIIGAATRRSL